MQQYWTEITACVKLVTAVTMFPTIEVCLLSLIDPLVPTKAISNLLTLLFFFMLGKFIFSPGRRPLQYHYVLGRL